MPVVRVTRLRRAAAVFGLLALVTGLVTGLGAGPAWAPGTLNLHEVTIAVKGAPRLIAEINKELKSSGLSAGDVICTASRHGNHWRYLAGRRAAPYECKFGPRVLTVEAEITYSDADGRPLGSVDASHPHRAKTFREKNFRWTWSP
jgi:hypothetical protein